MTRTCVICGGKFIGYKNAKYCGPKCREVADKARRIREKDARHALGSVCVVCGKQFWPAHRGRKTCSDACEEKWMTMRGNFGPCLGQTIECAVCGKPFVRLTANAKYCSKACARKRNRQKTRADDKKIRDLMAGRARLPRSQSLEDVVRAAAESGLSYGEYVARMESGLL